MTKDDIKIADVLRLKRPLCGLDLETTGLDPEEDRIIQVAVITCHPNGKVTERCKLVNPEKKLSQESIAIHHITNEELKDQPTWKVVGTELANGLGQVDICAYNGSFDLSFIMASCKREGIHFRPGLLIDPCVIFKNKVRHNLSAAVKYYLSKPLPGKYANIDLSGAHNALWDARASLLVLEAQLKAYQELPRTVSELHKELFHSVPAGYLDMGRKFKMINGKPHVCFGKWGRPPTPFENVPIDYFEWMLGTDFSESTKEVIKKYVKA